MLTSIQEKLLKLLKEIDDICNKNNIDYYLGGGCLLGAIRTGGFLPWDDDADIHMTRDAAMKFLKAASPLPEDRIIFRGELEDGTAPVHWRYEDISTACTGKYSTVFDTPAGVFVDFFILDPVKCNPGEINEIRSKFLLFLQYRDRYRISWKFPDEKLVKAYNKLREREKTEGFDNIKKEMEKGFWSETEGDHYILRCPEGHIIPKDHWGTPKRIKFEDMMISIPEKPEEILSYGYGSRWVDEPLVADRQPHISLQDMDIPYTVYNDEAEELKKNREAAKELFKNIKSSFFKMFEAQRAEHRKSLHLHGMLLVKKAERLLGKEGKDICGLVADRDMNGLEELFSGFYDMQFGTGNKWDVCMDIPEEYFYAALYPLLYRGEYERAGDLIERYRVFDACYHTERLSGIKTLCDDAKLINDLIYVKKDTAAAVKIADRYIPEWSWTLFMARIDAWLLPERESNIKKIKKRVQGYLEKFPRDGELLTCYGDALYAEGSREQAVFMYKKAFATLRNGLVYTHIKNRINETEQSEKSA